MLNIRFRLLSKFMFPALFYALFINGCTQSMRLYHDLTYTITLSEVDSSALVSGSQIGIVRFLSKSSNQPDIISSVFSDNLLFFLHKNGLKGTIVNSDLSTKTPDMMQQAGANANASIVSVSQKQNTSYLLSPDQVKEISVATSADYVITGFVHETKAGNFLDPVQSSGIIVYVYSKNGSQVVQMQFIGSSPLELYDNSSEVARVFANRISDLVRSKKR